MSRFTLNIASTVPARDYQLTEAFDIASRDYTLTIERDGETVMEFYGQGFGIHGQYGLSTVAEMMDNANRAGNLLDLLRQVTGSVRADDGTAVISAGLLARIEDATR